ncbi:hypothetical protein GCM10027202_12370 [Microvirgula curvata]
MAQNYRDPTFDIVAAREAAAQREADKKIEQARREAERRADPRYTAMRRRKIARLVKRAMSGIRK